MDTQLPEFVLAGLYKDVLVITEPTPSLSAKLVLKGNEINSPEKPNIAQNPAEVKKWWLGSNNRQIAILVEDKSSVFIGDKELEFLTNILKACKLSIADVALINYARTPRSYIELSQDPECTHFLIFGLSPAQLQLQFTFPPYQSQTVDQSHFLLAAPLSAMMSTTQEAKAEKMKLWNALQQFFHLKG